MEAIADLPEIKSELNTDDFGSHNPVVTTNSHTPQPQQPQHEQQQNNCQWVSRTTFFLLRSSWCLVVLSPGQKSLSSCLNIGEGRHYVSLASCNLPST